MPTTPASTASPISPKLPTAPIPKIPVAVVTPVAAIPVLPEKETKKVILEEDNEEGEYTLSMQEKLLSIHSKIDIGLQSTEIPEPSHSVVSSCDPKDAKEVNVFTYKFNTWTDPRFPEIHDDDSSNGLLISPNSEYMLNFDVLIMDLDEQAVVDERNNVNLLVSVVNGKLRARSTVLAPTSLIMTKNIEIVCEYYNFVSNVLVPEIVYTTQCTRVKKLRSIVNVYISKAKL